MTNKIYTGLHIEDLAEKSPLLEGALAALSSIVPMSETDLASLQHTYSRSKTTTLPFEGTNPAYHPANGKIIRIAAYCRCSISTETTGGHTFQTQTGAIEEWATHQYGHGNFRITYYGDDGITGAAGSDAPLDPSRGASTGRRAKTRLGLRKCRQCLRSGQADVLVVYALSRLARNTHLVLDIINKDIKERKLGFHSVFEGSVMDPYTATGMMLLSIMATLATYQRDETSLRCRAAKITAYSQGYPVGKACFGWRIGYPDGTQETVAASSEGAASASSQASNFNQGRERPRYFQIPEQAALVQQMRSWFLSGWSIARIGRELEARGVLTPSGLRHWHVTVVMRILFNPTHAGLVSMKGKMAPGEHFPRRLFEVAEHEELLRLHLQHGRTQPTRTRGTGDKYSLTGLVTCGHCKSRLYVASPDGPTSVALACNKRHLHADDASPRPRVSLAALEAFVEGHVRALVESPRMQEQLDRAASEALGQEQTRLIGEQKRLNDSLQQNTRRAARLRQMAMDELIDTDEFREGNAELQASKQATCEELARVEAALSQRAGQEHQHARLRQALLSFDKTWPHLDPAERHAVLELLIENLGVRCEGEQKIARLKLHLMPEVEGPVVPIPRVSKPWKHHPNGPGGVDKLTPRSLALLHWHSKGLASPEIAIQMHIAESTVRTLVSEIRHLLGVHELDEAAALAMPKIKENLATLPLGAHYNHGQQGPLKPCHLQVLRFMGNNATPKDIAEENGLSINTIRNYQGEIYHELGVHSAYKAVCRARELKLIV